MSGNNTPALLIMAAGMGSRYGGLKQIEPIGPSGEILIDYSLYDARRAGFKKLVFVISRRIERDFKETMGGRLSGQFDSVDYVIQDIGALPDGYVVPAGRSKPWGTGHAVLCAKENIDGPFAVINADDYYGANALSAVYERLVRTNSRGEWCMAGYRLTNTLTEHGYVARGICDVDDNGMLRSVIERVRIEKCPSGARYTEDDGQSYTDLPEYSTVSMNLWGFTPDVFEALKRRFPMFLEDALKSNPKGAEYFLPAVIGEAINSGEARVYVLPALDRWYGVTYREDKALVSKAIYGMINAGLYPLKLWA